MKKLLFVFAIIALVFAVSSCASTKRDCRGVKHYKQPGGFYM